MMRQMASGKLRHCERKGVQPEKDRFKIHLHRRKCNELRLQHYLSE